MKNLINVNLPKSKTQEFLTGSALQENNKKKEELMREVILAGDEQIELKIKGDSYAKIGITNEWRHSGNDHGAYFSYQEKAAKDFIYRFNKCGILSDQVGMGKTIEAGMIISELAYRNDLNSLLILVPNGTMAVKWENELAKKFGFRNIYEDITQVNGENTEKVDFSKLPRTYSVKDLASFYALVYEGADAYKFNGQLNKKIINCALKVYDELLTDQKKKTFLNKLEKDSYNVSTQTKTFKLSIFNNYLKPFVEEMVKIISDRLGFRIYFDNANYFLSDSGNFYHIIDAALDTTIDESLNLANGLMNRIFKKNVICHAITDEFYFVKSFLGKEYLKNLENKASASSTDEEILEGIKEIREVAKKISSIYRILVVSKRYSTSETESKLLLSEVINSKYQSESIKFFDENPIDNPGYTLIDMLIDMSYRTLIVDEAHDYIDVSHKKHMVKTSEFSREFSEGPIDTSRFHVFPLFDDYYYVRNDCLFVKMKQLADRTYRKIFMTATPIKSDVVDFYLLTLLADNTDAVRYNKVRDVLTEEDTALISQKLNRKIDSVMKRALNAYSHQDLVVRYIVECYLRDEHDENSTFEKEIAQKIREIKSPAHEVDEEILEKASENKARKEFETTFTFENGTKKVKSLSEIIDLDDGLKTWHDMYSQLGIRSTRHQTFRLDDEHLAKINKIYQNKYRNLPNWSKRNGLVVKIVNEDTYLDSILEEILDEKTKLSEQLYADKDNDDKILLNSTSKTRAEKTEEYSKEANAAIEAIRINDTLSDEEKDNEYKKIAAKYSSKIEELEAALVKQQSAEDIYKYINNQLKGECLTSSSFSGYGLSEGYDSIKMHMIVSLLTGGLQLSDSTKMSLEGKVLLFANEKSYEKVWKELNKELKTADFSNEEANKYAATFLHYPLGYFNKMNPAKAWKVSHDIRELNDTEGNCIILVEPGKFEEGVDLQKSTQMINFDIPFSPLKMEQRIGRIDRVKLNDKQENLQIICFTPLNDISGFITEFYATELKMFSCWKGDTTGIVSLPIGEQENSATFEDAINTINEAYKSLYNMDLAKYNEATEHLVKLTKDLESVPSFRKFKGVFEKLSADSLGQKATDFAFMANSIEYINMINKNFDKNDPGDKFLFGVARQYAEEKAGREVTENTKKYSLDTIISSITNYYDSNVKALKEYIEGSKQVVDSTEGYITGGGSNANTAARAKLLATIQSDKNAYYQSYLYHLSKGRHESKINKEYLYEVVNPIFNLFKEKFVTYLNPLLEFFDSLCKDVINKSDQMSRLVSYSTIEELKGVSSGYGKEE